MRLSHAITRDCMGSQQLALIGVKMIQEEFLRMKDLANRPDSKGLIGVSSQTIWRWIQQKRFPAPIRLSSNISVWRMSEIQAWMKLQSSTEPDENYPNKWLNRKQASEYLAQHLDEKDAFQWENFLMRNIRQSQHVYKLAFKEIGKRICYSETTLRAFIKSSTTPYNQMNKGVK